VTAQGQLERAADGAVRLPALPSRPTPASQPQVFFDGGCPVCSREIAFYKTRAGAEAFEWVNVVDSPPQALGPGLSREVAMARMHVRLADGTLLSGAAAFAALWRRMPGFRALGWLLGVPPFGVLAELGYRGFLLCRRLWRTPKGPTLLTLLLLGATLLARGAGAACSAYLDHDFQKLHSNETVNICKAYAGKPLLIVNTASHCGYTPQFTGLESLHQKYRKRGLVVLGFPSDDFNQEAKDQAETAQVCYVNYGVTFTMLAPLPVKGAAANPVFKELNRQSREPSWNFNKYLVKPDALWHWTPAGGATHRSASA
jgi:glutathione peroxidase